MNLILLPILIPLFSAALMLLFWRWVRFQRIAAVIANLLLLITSLWLLLVVQRQGIQVVHLGNYTAPFGITMVADLFSAIMVTLAGVMALVVSIYSLVDIETERVAFGYFPLFQILIMGVCGAFLTGDLFNLYVWFEVMLIASFVLLALGGERAQLEGALKYVTINLVSSTVFLTAVGLLYGIAGTLNLADLSLKINAVEQSGLFTTLSMLFLAAFGVKAAIFPLFFWLPASYHTPPVAVSALFAGLLTKVGVYAMIRVFTLLFTQDTAFTHTLILVISAFTMVTGVLGALAQDEFRRLLSFHIVSQVGYMVMGLGLFTPLALAGAVFYIIHHIIVKSNLFLISGLSSRLGYSFRLSRLGGLLNLSPLLALLFLIPALSLAGIPPFSGFFAKLILIQAGVGAGQYWIVAVALAVSLLTLRSMFKIWEAAFWKPAGEQARQPDVIQAAAARSPLLWIPVAALALITVFIGLASGPLFDLSQAAADQLLVRETYIAAVLGGQNP